MISNLKRLILTRKKGEKVIIHDNGEVLVKITVLPNSRSNRVALSIESDPIDFDVDREEVYNAKFKE